MGDWGVCGVKGDVVDTGDAGVSADASGVAVADSVGEAGDVAESTDGGIAGRWALTVGVGVWTGVPGSANEVNRPPPAAATPNAPASTSGVESFQAMILLLLIGCEHHTSAT